jgi:hypothetical protein
MQGLRAFVGHSFGDQDRALVSIFCEHFDNLAKAHLGFTWDHAVEAEPSPLSDKVLAKIEGKNVFIGICTRNELAIRDTSLHHYIKIPPRLRDATTWNNLGVSFSNFDMPAKSNGAFQCAEIRPCNSYGVRLFVCCSFVSLIMTSSPIPQAWDTAFEPYAMEIGFLLREWSDLQERLLSLFVTLLRWPNKEIGRSIWHAVQNDRSQRRMLLGAASALYNPAHPSRKITQAQRDEDPFRVAFWDEIFWIVDSADGLGQRRDAAAHSPVAMLVADPLEFIARHYHGNPLAETLRGKKLLIEFALYRERAAVLRKHAEAINRHIETNMPLPLPQRPPWPKRPAAPREAAG